MFIHILYTLYGKQNLLFCAQTAFASHGQKEEEAYTKEHFYTQLEGY